jgi:hypothetical protein
MEFKYKIGDKTYLQRPLVLIQILQLIDALEGLKFPVNFTLKSILKILGDRTSKVLAIILIPEDIKIQDKNIEELAMEMDNVDLNTLMEIKNHFFEFNRIASLSVKDLEMAMKIESQLRETFGTPSMRSALSSREEISQKEILSSMDSASENANLISSTDREK